MYKKSQPYIQLSLRVYVVLVWPEPVIDRDSVSTPVYCWCIASHLYTSSSRTNIIINVRLYTSSAYTGFGHTPSWVKIFGHFGATLDACTHVQRRHGCIGRQHAYNCEATPAVHRCAYTIFEGITGFYHTPPWWK